MKSSSDITCRMAALGQWSPEMHMWGVDFSTSSMSLSRTAFSCCDANGLKIVDAGLKTATMCGLLARWGRLTWFLQQIKALAPGESLPLIGACQRGHDDEAVRSKSRCLAGMVNLFFKDELRELLQGNKGKIVDTRKLKKRMHLGLAAVEAEALIDRVFQDFFWQIGAALIWHFDMVVLPFRIAGLARSAPSSKLPLVTLPVATWDELLRKHPGKRKLLLIDGVTELWNPNRLEALEATIAFASERQIPIWMHDESTDVSETVESAKSQDRSFRGSVNRKLGQLRSRPAVEWLSDQSLSRLEELSALERRQPNHRGIPEIV